MQQSSLARLLAADRSTNLQRGLLALHQNLAYVRGLSAREQAVFGDVAQRAIVRSLGPAMIVAEAEELTRRAA